jgi:hypothetical protein
MRSVHPTLVGALVLCAGLAIPHGAATAEGNFSTVWRPVNNRYSTVTGEATGLHGSYYTFDLFLRGDAGTRINAINMGYAADPSVHNEYVYHDGDNVYEHDEGHGWFAPNPLVFPYAAAAEFDTYVTIGDVAPLELAAVGGSMRLDHNIMRGIWFIVPGGDGFPASIDESGELRIMRLTVSTDTTIVGGVGSRIQVGTIIDGNPTEPNVLVPVQVSELFVIPAPSAAGVLTLGGLALTRRRR